MDQNQKSKLIRVKRLAKLLDSQFKGPLGTKFGLDGLIGLIPGLGDIITSFLSGVILYEAYRMGASGAVLMRMGLNILIENLVDAIPFIGNVFDFFWKANLKNVHLLESHIVEPVKKNRESKIILISIFLLILGLLTFSIYVSYLIIKLILQAFYLFTS